MKNLIFSMLAMAAMVSCSSESDLIDEVNPVAKTPIEFNSSILTVETKAVKTGAAFAANDNIAILGYKGASAPTGDFSTPFMNNATFTYDATTKFTSTDASAFWELGKTHHFYAYSPIATTTADGTGYQFTAGTASVAPTLAITCQETTGIEQDLLWATTNPIEYTAAASGSQTLAFTHKLARIAFNIKLAEKASSAELSKIEFNVDKAAASFNLITGIVAPTDGSVLLSNTLTTAKAVTTGGIDADFSPIIFNTSTISGLKITVNGKEFSVDIKTAPTFEAGKITTVTITLTAKGLGFDASITDWATGGTAGAGEV